MAGVIPHAEAQERVDGTEDRLLGVVDALKYYDSGDGGFGFLRRHKSTKANARDVVPTGTVIELPPKQERWSRDALRFIVSVRAASLAGSSACGSCEPLPIVG